MQKRSDAFTLIEAVFVIVVLGILASIAIPKFSATREDAKIAAGRATVAAVRSAIIAERQSRMLRGESNYMPSLPAKFAGLLTYEAKDWSGSGTSFTYSFGSGSVTYIYTPANGKFECNAGACNKFN